ncbi:hypothetical protein BDK51DRAFT_25502 [Blyttiomyces helicus]|uniref:Uncharacterized protein n=1 Tax=Blyttiomyces helicus TaxID=388810 RepID=A0A4P9W580_9FUNG|nr:hypothetical protein BDK51DRAFT_25502 [Blyttiomyces helicus]|eukprot:RKO87551.1 hypothetical protein BDK51DRAFT_25502 [Blyttiomyces helicus]
MCHLIDSIMKNYFVPPIILSKIPSKTDPTGFVRLMNNEIPHIDPLLKKKVWYAHPTKPSLSIDDRMMFNERLFLCAEYSTLTEQQEEEMFRRVQLGVALSVAERLAANISPIGDFIRDLIKKYEYATGLIVDMRKRIFQIHLQTLYLLLNPDGKLPSHQRLEALATKRKLERSEMSQRVQKFGLSSGTPLLFEAASSSFRAASQLRLAAQPR